MELDNLHFLNHKSEIANCSTKYFILSKVYTDVLSTCMGDNPLAKARGLSPCTGGQTMG